MDLNCESVRVTSAISASVKCPAAGDAGASIRGVVRSSHGARIAYAVVTLACVVGLSWFFSPLARALATRMMD